MDSGKLTEEYDCDNAGKRLLYESLQPGDFIYAYMRRDNKALRSIPIDHRQRPYVVIRTEDEKIYAYPCYTKKPRGHTRYRLSGFRYNMWKDESYVKLSHAEELTIGDLIRKLDTLAEDDIAKINRLLSDCGRTGDMIGNKIGCRKGDLINYSGLYYVFKCSRKNILVHPVYKQNLDDSCFLVEKEDGHKKYIQTGKMTSLELSDKYQIVYTCSDAVIEGVQTKKRIAEWKARRKKKKSK